MKKFIKKLVRNIKRLLDKIIGTTVNELYWRSRSNAWAEGYLSPQSFAHPHRQFLIERISRYSPFESILEVGCASGPNLYLLAKQFPDIKLYGVDINKRAIKLGRKWFTAKGINCTLSVHKAEDLRSFHDKSIDILFTQAVLVYIGPDKIEYALKEFIRVTKKMLILNEWHSESPVSIYNDHWMHNYKNLLKKFVSEDKIKLTKIPKNIGIGDWAKYGYIIEVNLEK